MSVSLSSWKGRTVRAALSTAYAVTAAHTPTRPAARSPSCPPTRWAPLRPCRLLPPSRCPSCPPLTAPQPMGRSRRNRTPSRSGRSPGACTRAVVSSPPFVSTNLASAQPCFRLSKYYMLQHSLQFSLIVLRSQVSLPVTLIVNRIHRFELEADPVLLDSIESLTRAEDLALPNELCQNNNITYFNI